MFSLEVVDMLNELDGLSLRICCSVCSSGRGLQFSMRRGKVSKRLTWRVAEATHVRGAENTDLNGVMKMN